MSRITEMADRMSEELHNDSENSIKRRIPDDFKYFGIRNSTGESLLSVICETKHEFELPDSSEYNLLSEVIPSLGETVALYATRNELFFNGLHLYDENAHIPLELLRMPSGLKENETVLEHLIVHAPNGWFNRQDINSMFPCMNTKLRDNKDSIYSEMSSRGVNLATLCAIFNNVPMESEFFDTVFPLPSELEWTNYSLEGFPVDGRSTLLNLNIGNEGLDSRMLQSLKDSFIKKAA